MTEIDSDPFAYGPNRSELEKLNVSRAGKEAYEKETLVMYRELLRNIVSRINRGQFVEFSEDMAGNSITVTLSDGDRYRIHSHAGLYDGTLDDR